MASVSLSRAVRWGRWPNDETVAMISQRDHTRPIDADDLRAGIDRARRSGRRALRTSALLEVSAAVAESIGFVRLDTLALLSRDLGAAVPEPRDRDGVRLRPLHRWHQGRAAVIDQAAFGALWGMDRAALTAIRHATARHWARQVHDDAGEMLGFIIIGLGHPGPDPTVTTGYLQRLSVHPDHQGRGLGRLLVDDAITTLTAAGAGCALVNTGVDNHRALALYRSAGFERNGAQMTVWEYGLDGDGARANRSHRRF
jgi:ribosomal protein S18 acetylase RimI-like enzyme